MRNIKQNNWSPFNKRLWQRNFYERIIRDENELNRIRKYIIENPFKWDWDKENPNNMEND
jgi:putative transposase